ncbi:MAG: hypothetical protein FJX72_05535 [Armatimonadetes bacterium]|nr:hypothetical protein [Armatimonadota bacterium]
MITSVADIRADHPDVRVPDALVVRELDVLSCYERNAGDAFQLMTVQRQHRDVPLRFPVCPSELGHVCLPKVLAMLFVDHPVCVWLIDGDRAWSCGDLETEIGAFRAVAAGYPEGASVLVFAWAATETGSVRPVAHFEVLCTPRVRESPAQETWCGRSAMRAFSPDDLPANSIRTGPLGPVRVGDLDDIPAEFDRYIWTEVRAQVTSIGNSMVRRLSGGHAWFSTLDAARRMQPSPFLGDAIEVYRILRSMHGTAVGVPMVGFREECLTASSYLGPYSRTAEYDVRLSPLHGIRQRRLALVDVPPSRGDRLLASARRCLAIASQDLKLADLCEDVICDLTGVRSHTLSLGDVARIHTVLRGKD